MFYVHNRERERERENARARLERETIAQRGDTMMMMMMMMTKKKTKKKRTTVLTVKQRHFPQAQAYICVQTPANAPTKVAEDVKSFFYNRVVVYYILRFFCDDVTTRFVFDFHKIFSQTFLSLSSL